MASPPTKRQRTSKVVFSDDEEEELGTARQKAISLRSTRLPVSSSRRGLASQQSGKSAVQRSKHKQNKDSSNATSPKAVLKTESPSPHKPKKSPRKKKTEDNSKSLDAFFSRVSEEQRWNRTTEPATKEIDDVETGDAIEDDDDSLDEAFSQLAEGQGDVKFQLDRRKDKATLTKNGTQTFRKALPASSHKFVKPPTPNANRNNIKVEMERNPSLYLHRPWADRYGPASLEELAVHKKKVADVQKWLGEVLNGRDPRKILVLKGPAGSGKTTCITLLSTALKFQVLYWSNPTVSDMNVTASVVSQFDDFVNRSGHFSSLDFDAEDLKSLHAKPVDQPGALHRVLVIEEFPTNMTRSSSALEAFRGVLLRYLATAPSASNPMFRKNAAWFETTPPIILIISESLLTSATASADSFTAHRLLGPEILNHPLVTVLEFNTVAPTIIGKALDLIIKKEARDSQRRRIPGPAILKKLSEMGDIRSAVNALEFLCARSADNDGWSGTVATKMKKPSKDGVALTPMEQNSLELVTQREATLGMFHAVGKVVYNKREDPQIADPKSEPPPKPPDHLSHMHKPKISQVSIDDLMNETGTDIPTFVSTLHENYVLSCSGSSFLESCDSCIDALSDSDILSPEGRSMSRVGYGRGVAGNRIPQAGGIDMLRQNEISFHVAVRGLLFSLPHPVNRAAYPGGRKGDTFKIFYPAFLRLWKPMEETDSLISTIMDESMFADAKGPIRGQISYDGVASWKQKSTAFGRTPSVEESSSIPRILSSRTDMLYDRLPYLSKLHVSRELDIQKVKQVTQFRGALLNDDDDTEGVAVEVAIDLSAADETTDKSTSSPKRRDRIMRIGRDTGMGQGGALTKTVNNEVELEKLYISDDDIQDD